MRVVLAFFCLMALPLSAAASPWPRAQGGWFVASTIGLERAGPGRQRFGEIYAEYGATGQLTFATQLRHSPGGWRGDLLARWHPGARENAPPFGLSMGFRLRPGGSERALLLYGAHLGHSLDTPLGNVWTRLDVQMQAGSARPASPVELSLSGQMGLRDTRGFLGFVTATGKRRHGTTTLELSPAIGFEIAPARTVVMSLSASPSTPRMRSARLTLWSQF